MASHQTRCEQIMKEHQVVISVLQTRAMRINAALTFWKSKDFTQLISYLLRTNDDSLFVDILPFLTKSLTENEKQKQPVTLGVCLELLPILERLLTKKYEEYVVVSLDLIRTMMKTWYRELYNMKQHENNLPLNSSLSLPPIYVKLMSLNELVERLSKKSGTTATKAKVVHEILNQLM
uniref:KATNB1-like protein 1 n=1 Tax=Ciona intestinalis TaxID=7719 RepID=F6X8V6_CIOIN|nr:KATNB1-like protein 1 [Ciona intestinalis]|eukprot:XP_026689781.1 KATNB1-like protein 1 [Ciona intestinalis]